MCRIVDHIWDDRIYRQMLIVRIDMTNDLTTTYKVLRNNNFMTRRPTPQKIVFFANIAKRTIIVKEILRTQNARF